jgi:glycine/D-amino acid oxidase-like deaminating enzyme
LPHTASEPLFGATGGVHLPIIDHQAGPDGLVFVTGLSGHGLALAPVIGEITADLAVDGATARPIRPFRLARFREERVELPNKMI